MQVSCIFNHPIWARSISFLNRICRIEANAQLLHYINMVKTAQPTPENLLRDVFRLNQFRPGQLEIIQALQKHNAALAVFPTGGGKSLCYQLFSQMVEGVTLVVSPLIALMKDQIDSLEALGIPAGRLDSTLEKEDYRQLALQLQQGKLKLLYVAPERFNNERFRALMSGLRIALFAVDEAHCISEWGHNFRPDYLKLVQYAKAFGAERLLALTAPATTDVVKDICPAFSVPPAGVVITSAYRQNLFMSMAPVAGMIRSGHLVRKIRSRPPGTTIVYVTLQKTADQVARDLVAAGLNAKAYHAGMEKEARDVVQNWWMAKEDAIVVATIAFGMGIDKASVRYVYHYNLPKSLEGYAQEIGRAGRDGQPAIVELMGDHGDRSKLENFAWGDTPDPGDVAALVDYMMQQPETFTISPYQFGNQFDLRPLVLRTALIYLELLGILEQSTPQFATYQIRLLEKEVHFMDRHNDATRQFYQNLFNAGKRGRIWITIDIMQACEAMKKNRNLILRSITYLEDHGWAEVRASGPELTFKLLQPEADKKQLTLELNRRFRRREEQDLERIQQVIQLAEADQCKTIRLLEHFGEQRMEPCGHCTWCKEGKSQLLPVVKAGPPIPQVISPGTFKSLKYEYPRALRNVRQQVRFLLGITSPTLTFDKLHRHTLFGVLEDYPLQEVIQWCKAL